jgi:hypothetical protein
MQPLLAVTSTFSHPGLGPAKAVLNSKQNPKQNQNAPEGASQGMSFIHTKRKIRNHTNTKPQGAKQSPPEIRLTPASGQIIFDIYITTCLLIIMWYYFMLKN